MAADLANPSSRFFKLIGTRTVSVAVRALVGDLIFMYTFVTQSQPVNQALASRATEAFSRSVGKTASGSGGRAMGGRAVVILPGIQKRKSPRNELPGAFLASQERIQQARLTFPCLCLGSFPLVLLSFPL